MQPNVCGPFLPEVELPRITDKKMKQRSVSVESRDLDTYVAGARVGPHPLVTRNNKNHESEAALIVIASGKNLIWILA